MDTLFRVSLAYGASPIDVWPALGARPKRAAISPNRVRGAGQRRVSPQMQAMVNDISPLPKER
jgi:hypothetical protein